MKQFLLRQKFRLDMGHQLLAVINLALLARQFGGSFWTAAGVVIAGLFLVWLLGFGMDCVGYMQGYNREANDRNENWDRLFKRLDQMEATTDRVFTCEKPKSDSP